MMNTTIATDTIDWLKSRQSEAEAAARMAQEVDPDMAKVLLGYQKALTDTLVHAGVMPGGRRTDETTQPSRAARSRETQEAYWNTLRSIMATQNVKLRAARRIYKTKLASRRAA